MDDRLCAKPDVIGNPKEEKKHLENKTELFT